VDHQEPRFPIEYCAPGQAAGTILHRTGDPNCATLAFHRALRHLHKQGHDGAVVLRCHDAVVLRQPITAPEASAPRSA
jgi:hypothetical protein